MNRFANDFVRYIRNINPQDIKDFRINKKGLINAMAKVKNAVNAKVN